MEFDWIWMAMAATAYLWGSLNHAVVLSFLAGKGDVRAQGSGNPGTANVLRTLGKPWALAVLVLDSGRGFVCAWGATSLLSDPWPVVGVCAAVLLGNLFPVFHGFRGGKGVATALGLFLWLAPLGAGIGLVIYLSIVLAFRISAVGSICMLASYPLTTWLLGSPLWVIVTGGGLFSVILWTHRSNLVRLLKGQESRLGRR